MLVTPSTLPDLRTSTHVSKAHHEPLQLSSLCHRTAAEHELGTTGRISNHHQPVYDEHKQGQRAALVA